jgi:hypothetical protein
VATDMGHDTGRRGILDSLRLRRGAPGTGLDADLDDLFSYEEVDSVGPPRLERRPWLVIALLQSFAASAVVYTGFRAADLAPSYLLIAAACAGAVLVRQAVLFVREPRWQRTGDLVRRPRATMDESRADGDGMLEAIGRWDRRLDWGTTNAERFGSAVARRLGELADERLRQRYALTRRSDPARARDLLGEQTWAIIHGQVAEAPTPAAVALAVARIESL